MTFGDLFAHRLRQANNSVVMRTAVTNAMTKYLMTKLLICAKAARLVDVIGCFVYASFPRGRLHEVFRLAAWFCATHAACSGGWIEIAL